MDTNNSISKIAEQLQSETEEGVILSRTQARRRFAVLAQAQALDYLEELLDDYGAEVVDGLDFHEAQDGQSPDISDIEYGQRKEK